ncbi:recombination protein NinG [Trabulsiella odontotermitis]|uniref:recombination protein NinG n=1 Tax=Trabulsiella odontotermitis TaxID=379893 RepID=UPI00092CE7C2|nr:recombination protein NinG [Trabulsiella odontotermitis]
MKQLRRKCLSCRERFAPASNGQVVCSWSCNIAQTRKKAQKARTAALRKPKTVRRPPVIFPHAPARKPKSIIKPIGHWLELTQRHVNELRRKTCLANGDGCISCGTHCSPEWHAGHYRTVAVAGHLRFEPDNIWLQCSCCNVDKSGNRAAFRAALVARIGESRVLALENDNRLHRWTRGEVKVIRLKALADLRSLNKTREAA